MAKKRKLNHIAARTAASKRQKHVRRKADVSGKTASPAGPASNAGHERQKQRSLTGAISQGEPTIPFAPEEAILLVGEGDLSFAASLVQHHGCVHVTATVQESDQATLEGKYPDAASNIATIEAEEGCSVTYGVDARKMGPWTTKSRSSNKDSALGAMDRIIFNFPHVGGKSTDVNRQVRYNQELLVDFFGRALLSLAPGGSVIVTLFEGDPYTLWNIRDLGRHAGLAVERSFRFHAAAYPGYHHARTLGVIRDKAGNAGGGWKGEERASRSYIFVRKGDVPRSPATSGMKRKSVSQPEQSSDGSDDSDGG
jgi:25S rRNA (uracil2634-N3)-methyltransferase